MAVSIIITELQLLMEQLKSEITVELPGSKLADAYCGIIDGFILFCKELPKSNPVDNVPRYFKQVAGVDPYMHPSTCAARPKQEQYCSLEILSTETDLLEDTSTIPFRFQKCSVMISCCIPIGLFQTDAAVVQ
ncbi:hypothetical protein [Desulfosporosinus sp. BG]|uniref:hypothetical protein n=1 Tax=Desulfosporosinus sp. BG TaxID=1633135 RepID=UPI00083B8179|nr:hypothetical protein [Desulfosporosinus sp. BG]